MPAYVTAWTIEWEWLIATALVGVFLSGLFFFRLSRWLHLNLGLEKDSIGSAIANAAPPYIAILVLLFTCDIIAESTLHMPRMWYLPTTISLLVLAILVLLLMIVRIKNEIFRVRYEPVHRKRRARKARKDLSKN